MIVITAPTGTIGRQVVDLVLARAIDQPVRVIARDPSRLPAGVRERATVIEGSHGDPAVLARALDGARSLFWLLPNDTTSPSVTASYLGFTEPVLPVIRDSGVRIVGITALGRTSPLAGRSGFVTASLAMDDRIAATGVPFRALANASFMDNLLRQAAAIRNTGVITDAIPPDLPIPFVATRDIAAVSAGLLLDDGWTGHDEVPLLGPEHLSWDRMAAIVSDVLGRPVSYRQIDGASLKGFMQGNGMSEPMAQGYVDMMLAKAEGLDLAVQRTPEITARTPTTLRRFVEEQLRPAVLGGGDAV